MRNALREQLSHEHNGTEQNIYEKLPVKKLLVSQSI